MNAADAASGGILSKIIDKEKSAIADNHFNDMVKDTKVGIGRKIFSFVPDLAGDVTNMATFGAFGHIRGLYNKICYGIPKPDYKGLKADLKKTPKMTIRERAVSLLPDDYAQSNEVQAEPGG